ncbi:MAG: sigma-70 family RNA polymerase sigma factor [Blastochloris sp.]|nr:sigma-70 family RNA polymerase sigma factor [Blastochloris sp.]
MEEFSDEQLMELIGHENEAAFAVLLRRHQDLVYGSIHRMLGPYNAETEDLAQQVFLKVWKAAPRYRAEARFTTWLLTICRNCVFTQLKKSQRQKTEPLEFQGVDGEGESPHPDHDMPTPSAEMLREEMRQHVEEALCQLPLSQRTALSLRQHEQLDYDEIARVMGLSVSSVKSLLFRARETLREQLKNYLDAT